MANTFRRVALACLLGLGLNGAVLISSLDAVAASVTPLGHPVAGTLAEIGGPAGWASANGLDPAVGRAAPAGAPTLRTTVGSPTGTVGVGATCSQWNVGSVLGDGLGTESLSVSQPKMAFASNWQPTFLSAQDVLDVMPTLTFSYAVYDYGRPSSIQYRGHYSLDPSNGRVQVDDSSTSTPPNGHRRLTLSNDSKLNDNILGTNSTAVASLKKVVSGSNSTITSTMNKAIADVYTSYAAGLAFPLGSASVPLSFGYSVSGLTSGQETTVGLIGATAGSWTDGLAAVAPGPVPVSFVDQSVGWRQAFDAKTLAGIVGSSVEDAFDATFGHAFAYDRLVTAITGQTLTQLTQAFSAAADQLASGLATNVAGANETGQPISGYSDLQGALSMDSINGTTAFWGGQAPTTMYPTLHDDLAKSLATLLQQRAAKQWYDLARLHMSGTATVGKTFTPGNIKTLVPTNVTQLTHVTTSVGVVVQAGQTAPVEAQVVEPATGAQVGLTYSVADPSVAAVDADGLVRGLAAGATTVTVKATLSCSASATPDVLTAQVPVTVDDTPLPQATLSPPPAQIRPVGTGGDSLVTLPVAVTTPAGQPLPGQVVEFAVAGGAGDQPALAQPSCTTADDGTCSVTLTSTLAGRFTVTATLDGRALANSPASVAWQAGAADAAASSLSATPASIEAGQTTRVSVTLVDAYGNPVSGLTRSAVALSSSPAGVSFQSDFTEEAGRPGVYAVTATAGAAGVYTLSARPAGTVVSADLTVAPGPPAGLRLMSPATAQAGTDVELTADVTDSWANPVDGLTAAQFALDAGGLTVRDGPTGLGSGEYSWTVTQQTAGDYTARLTLGDLKSETPISLTAGAPATLVWAVAGSPAPASLPGSATITATATVKDTYGNAALQLFESNFTWLATAHNLSTGADEPAGQVQVSGFANHGDGTYSWLLSSVRTGDYKVALSAGAAAGEAYPISFAGGRPTLVQWRVTTPSVVVGQPAEVTVTVRDALGNGLAVDPQQLTGSFSSDPVGLTIGGWTAGTDNYGRATGVYAGQVQGTAPGDYRLVMALPDAPVADDTLTLTPPPPPAVVAPTIERPAPDVPLVDAAATFAGTAAPQATVAVTANGVPGCSTTADDAGAWSCLVQGLKDGSVTVKATATDSWGRIASVVSVYTVSLPQGTTAPPTGAASTG